VTDPCDDGLPFHLHAQVSYQAFLGIAPDFETDLGAKIEQKRGRSWLSRGFCG
jgi:hypothetical protein